MSQQSRQAYGYSKAIACIQDFDAIDPAVKVIVKSTRHFFLSVNAFAQVQDIDENQ
jgi:hypothetical protein